MTAWFGRRATEFEGIWMFLEKSLKVLGPICLGGALSVSWAQTASPTAPGAQQPTGGGNAEKPAETRLTQAQAKELFRSVDDILHFASDDSKLAAET